MGALIAPGRPPAPPPPTSSLLLLLLLPPLSAPRPFTFHLFHLFRRRRVRIADFCHVASRHFNVAVRHNLPTGEVRNAAAAAVGQYAAVASRRPFAAPKSRTRQRGTRLPSEITIKSIVVDFDSSPPPLYPPTQCSARPVSTRFQSPLLTVTFRCASGQAALVKDRALRCIPFPIGCILLVPSFLPRFNRIT